MILELVIFLTINCILGIFHPAPTLPLASKFWSVNKVIRRSSDRSTHTCKLNYCSSAAHGVGRSQPFLEIFRLTCFTHLPPSLLLTRSGCTAPPPPKKKPKNTNSADPHGLHSCSNATSSNAERVLWVIRVGAAISGSQHRWDAFCKLGAKLLWSYLGLYVGLALTLAPGDKWRQPLGSTAMFLVNYLFLSQNT